MYLQQALTPEMPRASFERPIDLVHLARQTLGDRDLEREILNLFTVQARALLVRIGTAETLQERGDLAHTLKGSARAVGAWAVADAAELSEIVCEFSGREWEHAFRQLAASITSACAAIGEFQGMH